MSVAASVALGIVGLFVVASLVFLGLVVARPMLDRFRRTWNDDQTRGAS